MNQADTINRPGVLHLIPVGLGGGASAQASLPMDVQQLTARLSTYIVENAKTARAFLKSLHAQMTLRDITMYTLTEQTTVQEMRQWIQSLCDGGEMGLVSEAGCPAVADPGAQVVAQAHAMGIQVCPWVGPSSILLGLMASGLDGQRFAFHGYAPIDALARAAQLRAWEAESRKRQQTQILIETPYRNAALFAALLQELKNSTHLCIARAVTTQQEWIRTRTVAQWKAVSAPELHKLPTVFLFLGGN